MGTASGPDGPDSTAPRIGRLMGAVLLCAYCLYYYWLFTTVR